MSKRIGIIGCGPSGFLTIEALRGLAESGEIELVAFDKKESWGGLWLYSDEQKTDRWGDNVHASMYRNLWVNAPIEVLELHDAPFPPHYPSLPPREPIFKYINDYVTRKGLEKYMLLNTRVNNVSFDTESAKFTVKYEKFGTQRVEQQEFDHVVVANGHFTEPHEPHFEGQETFPGQLLHSHNFRDGNHFKGQRVLSIGGSFSSEDIAMQCWKFGAKHVTISARKPMGFDWPEGVVEKPILVRISGRTVTFEDGSSEDFDAIIKCTGYLHSFPFLDKELRLVTNNTLMPPLYKQTVFMNNPALFYVGMQNQYYTFPMFYLQGRLIEKILTGEFNIPSKPEMEENVAAEQEKVANIKSSFEGIDYQTEYVNELVRITGAPNYDAAHLLKAWDDSKHENIVNYRSKSYKSMFTGNVAPPGPNWVESKDASKMVF